MKENNKVTVEMSLKEFEDMQDELYCYRKMKEYYLSFTYPYNKKPIEITYADACKILSVLAEESISILVEDKDDSK